MKNKKRNITMIAVLVFVCAAVALNWSYNNRWGHPDSEMVSAEDSAMLDAAASRISGCRALRKRAPRADISPRQD